MPQPYWLGVASEFTACVSNTAVCETTAYHEAGHVWAGLYHGARVLSVTIEPAWDDGPARHGDTKIAWPLGEMSAREFHRRSVLVALAGPVAEMLHLGQPNELEVVAEWSADWQTAWHAAAPLTATHATRLGLLERSCRELFELLNADTRWNAVATIADHLLAHETLDEEMIDNLIVLE